MASATARRIIATATILVLVAGTARAGALDDFEADATRDRPDNDSQHHSHSSSNLGSSLSSDDDGWEGTLGTLAVALIVAPGAISWARASGDPEYLNDPNNNWIKPRQPGEPLIPMLRADLASMSLESDVEAVDCRVQAGWGPFAVEFNPTFYEEQDPDDKLDLYRIWGLYRMSLGNRIELDLGAGGVILEGNESHTGRSFTTPVLIQPRDWIVVEFRPIWSEINGSNLTEYEAGVLLNWKHFSAKAGYHWTHSPERSLDGPFIGFSARF